MLVSNCFSIETPKTPPTYAPQPARIQRGQNIVIDF